MPQALIVATPTFFREFIKEKLEYEGIRVDVSYIGIPAFTKLLAMLPDLIILDISDRHADVKEFIEKKRSDPNAKSIPMFISGPPIDDSNDSVCALAQTEAVRYFSKPLKFDLFLEAIGQVLQTSISIDSTPCAMELRLVRNVIYVEIAEGLNRDMLAMLKHKIRETIDANKISRPVLILTLSNVSFSFVDGVNIEMLFDNITADERLKKKNIKVISSDAFIKALVKGHIAYKTIEVASDFSLISNFSPDMVDIPKIDELKHATDENTSACDFDLCFSAGDKPYSEDNMLHYIVAVVDGDDSVCNSLHLAFTKAGCKCDVYNSCAAFLSGMTQNNYNMIVLDAFTDGGGGIDILKMLQKKKDVAPSVIIYSRATSRNTIVQVLKMGVKTYLVKPQKPETVVQKALEILNSKK